MFRKKPITRTLDSPRIEGTPLLRRVIDHEMGWGKDSLGVEFAPSPLGLSSVITSLLPERGRRPRVRITKWQDPAGTLDERGRLRAERINITEYPPELGGLTVIHAIAEDPNMKVTYKFPTIDNESDMPDVERMVWGYSRPPYHDRMGRGPGVHPFVEAAPGLGLIIFNLLAQADEILVLGQETNNFLAS